VGVNAKGEAQGLWGTHPLCDGKGFCPDRKGRKTTKVKPLIYQFLRQEKAWSRLQGPPERDKEKGGRGEKWGWGKA